MRHRTPHRQIRGGRACSTGRHSDVHPLPSDPLKLRGTVPMPTPARHPAPRRSRGDPVCDAAKQGLDLTGAFVRIEQVDSDARQRARRVSTCRGALGPRGLRRPAVRVIGWARRFLPARRVAAASQGPRAPSPGALRGLSPRSGRGYRTSRALDHVGLLRHAAQAEPERPHEGQHRRVFRQHPASDHLGHAALPRPVDQPVQASGARPAHAPSRPVARSPRTRRRACPVRARSRATPTVSPVASRTARNAISGRDPPASAAPFAPATARASSRRTGHRTSIAAAAGGRTGHS